MIVRVMSDLDPAAAEKACTTEIFTGGWLVCARETAISSTAWRERGLGQPRALCRADGTYSRSLNRGDRDIAKMHTETHASVSISSRLRLFVSAFPLCLGVLFVLFVPSCLASALLLPCYCLAFGSPLLHFSCSPCSSFVSLPVFKPCFDVFSHIHKLLVQLSHPITVHGYSVLFLVS